MLSSDWVTNARAKSRTCADACGSSEETACVDRYALIGVSWAARTVVHFGDPDADPSKNMG